MQIENWNQTYITFVITETVFKTVRSPARNATECIEYTLMFLVYFYKHNISIIVKNKIKTFEQKHTINRVKVGLFRFVDFKTAIPFN